MNKEGFLSAIISVFILSIIVLAVIIFFIYENKWIGFIFILLGFLHLAALKIFGIEIKTIWPDVVFGVVDNGFLVVGALVGADVAGIIGAVVGGSAANAITDGFAGIFEGWTAQYLHRHNIKERRTALSSALGKMAGCFFGAGVVLLIAWTFLSF